MTSTAEQTLPAASEHDIMETAPVAAQTPPGDTSDASDAAARRDEADHELALVQARLHQLRLAALAGTRYDADEFDAAVHTFRQAWAQAKGAHEAWREWRLSQGLPPTEPAPRPGGRHAA